MSTRLTTKNEANQPTWHRYPAVYEINTWVWLSELSQKHGKQVTLASVPADEWDALQYGFDAVWLMGVWERSPAGIAIANQDPGLVASFRQAVSDFRPEDNVGSPYCIRRYEVDVHLGGAEGLAFARRQLAQRGMKLILDYVPNHVALDHPWVAAHPEYFIRGNATDLNNDPRSYAEIDGTVFARGRDPYFPAWPDVLQLNAFAEGLRRAVKETVLSIASQCDGVRCDMAMLFLNDIFKRTWGDRAGSPPATEYWTDVISAVKQTFANFLFIAEAYWDMEWPLQQLGFDFCYDKKLYDRLKGNDAESIRLHLTADLSYQQKLLRFIENHDEPRAAAVFSPAKEQAAALMVATLPGVRLFHEGQFEGRTVRLPVFLGRRPHETLDRGLQHFYKKLLGPIDKSVFRDGQWGLCERTGWPDNASFQNLVAYSWWKDDDDDRYLIIANLSDSVAQAQVKVPWAGDSSWRLLDAISGERYERAGREMLSPGLYVDLAPWKYHFFQCLRD